MPTLFRVTNFAKNLLIDVTKRSVCINPYKFRALAKLVKTDQFRVYKVEDTQRRSVLSFLSLKQNTCRVFERFIAPISVILRPFLPFRMSISVGEPTEENMKMSSKNLNPPISVRGMKQLDRNAFKSDVKILGLKVPSRNVAVVSKRFKDSLLKIPKIAPIAELSDSDSDRSTHKLFLFDPKRFESSESFDSTAKEFLFNQSVDVNACKLYDIALTYENWMYDEILDSVLPENVTGVGGFTTVGHIAHLNLREELLEYKQLIGEVVLDKISSVKTVVNKLNVIDNTFRYFQMEVLAGEENFVTVAKEHGFAYEFDFSKVYWNSRLSTEHQRIVSLLNKGDIVYDMFAGVGPFAVPAAKKNCIVYANDLNPESYRWLGHNVKLNKVKGEVHLFNMDGREFVSSVVKKSLLELWSNPVENENPKVHIVMNLPAIAVEFLDVFRGLFSEVDVDSVTVLPMVHCYCFSKSKDASADAKQMVESVLGQSLPDSHDIRVVRNVAPNKEMLCVSFLMPKEILLGLDSRQNQCDAEPERKRVRLASESSHD